VAGEGRPLVAARREVGEAGAAHGQGGTRREHWNKLRKDSHLLPTSASWLQGPLCSTARYTKLNPSQNNRARSLIACISVLDPDSFQEVEWLGFVEQGHLQVSAPYKDARPTSRLLATSNRYGFTIIATPTGRRDFFPPLFRWDSSL
jgi:hypothetical protein